MTRKHFEAAAELVKLGHWSDDTTKRAVAAAFAELFGRFNPQFQIGRFYAACGIDL